MKYQIGDILRDENGNTGIVYIHWDDGDHCAMENDTAHPNPVIDDRPCICLFPVPGWKKGKCFNCGNRMEEKV